jgi:hypothetical protein
MYLQYFKNTIFYYGLGQGSGIQKETIIIKTSGSPGLAGG